MSPEQAGWRSLCPVGLWSAPNQSPTPTPLGTLHRHRSAAPGSVTRCKQRDASRQPPRCVLAAQPAKRYTVDGIDQTHRAVEMTTEHDESNVRARRHGECRRSLLPASLMCSNEAGHLFPVSVSKQDIRCRICKLGIHFVGRPTEMRG
jgi:hypothetical protein